MIISAAFFYVYEVFIFQVVRGVKGQKLAQGDKKILSGALHISGTIYHMIVIYGTLLSSDDISAKFFFIFSKFWFSWLLGGNRAKNSPKWQEIMSVAHHISGTIHHLIVIFGTQMQNDIARSFLIFFQNFSFSEC